MFFPTLDKIPLFLKVILYMAHFTGNIFWITLLGSQYSLVMDLGLVVLPSWLLLWASPSFRRQLSATFLPTTLYARIFGAPHTITIVKAQSAMMKTSVQVRPMQISSISKFT
jgi:MFS superfamily sulfate permease-like transporter